MAEVCKKFHLRSKVPHASPDLQQVGFDPESFLVAHGIQLLCSMNIYKKRFHSYFVKRWILEWSCCCWSRNISRSCKTAVPALGVERKSQQQQQVCEKTQLTCTVTMYSWCERLKNLFILDSCLSSKRSNMKAWKVMQLFGPACSAGTWRSTAPSCRWSSSGISIWNSSWFPLCNTGRSHIQQGPV